MKRIGDKETIYVMEVLASQFRSSAGGLMTKRLEDAFASKFGARFAVSFDNGTSTMHAALAAKGIGNGDEVIVPPLTMASTSLAVLHANAIPVFADIDPDTWTISPDSIEKCITPRTKAIIPVSIYGLAPDMDAIMDIADSYNLFVLEDDAQCFLGRYKKRMVGTIGHASSFSFQSSKHMTSGEGGMIITDDPDLADSIRRFNSLGYKAVGASGGKIRKQDIQSPDYERHISVGWNYRLSELCAAVALAQLERLDQLVEMRIKCAELYQKAAQGCPWLIPQEVPDHSVHSYWSYVLKLDNNSEFTWHDFRDKYIELGGDGIYGAWQLTYLEPVFKNNKLSKTQTQRFQKGLCPFAEKIQPRLLQFKTNYFDTETIQVKAEALTKTIDFFGV